VHRPVVVQSQAHYRYFVGIFVYSHHLRVILQVIPQTKGEIISPRLVINNTHHILRNFLFYVYLFR
jgi:hypothetical protein